MCYLYWLYVVCEKCSLGNIILQISFRQQDLLPVIWHMMHNCSIRVLSSYHHLHKCCSHVVGNYVLI